MAKKVDPRNPNPIVIQGIHFTPAGIATLTRDTLADKYGIVHDKNDKPIKRHWMKKEKHLDMIWDKIQELRKEKPIAEKPSESKSKDKKP